MVRVHVVDTVYLEKSYQTDLMTKWPPLDS